MRTSSSAALRAPAAPDDGRDLISARPQHDLIAGLMAIALREGIPRYALCEKIGIDHAMLSRASRSDTRKERLGIVTCAKIVTAYPELSDAAANYLADGFGWPIIRALAVLGQAAEAVEDVGAADDGAPQVDQ
jgi:hypothetical protein